MLTRLDIRNFKLFDDVSIELGERVVFVGPNNSGKSSALQALALWSIGVRKWAERRGDGEVPEHRPGVTINRNDLVASPVPSANLLWRGGRYQRTVQDDGKKRTRPITIDVEVHGIDRGEKWSAALEFDYTNDESFRCRAPLAGDGKRHPVPRAAVDLRLAYLPPMSGLAATERRLDEGAIAVLIGEGRTAEVLRNLCWQTWQREQGQWARIAECMQRLFGIELEAPEYVKERGEIRLAYRDRAGVRLDLSSGGRGQQQTLLLLAHMASHPGSVLLLDEPDAHLEILRQRQIYQLLTETAAATGSQIIAASHSEVVLNEAADRDTVVAFVGSPHRIDDRSTQQVAKALKEIGFESYVQAEQLGWVLYLEGATDLAVLQAFATRLGHPARKALDPVFAHYVGNQPSRAESHYFGLREAKPDLVGFALFDRIEKSLNTGGDLVRAMWRRREVENYLLQRETLLAWADAQGALHAGPLFGGAWRETMDASVEKIAGALQTLRRQDPWGPDIKASDDFLDPLFADFYQRLDLPNLMRKTDYHTLAPFVPITELEGEVREKLDAIVELASRARPRT